MAAAASLCAFWSGPAQAQGSCDISAEVRDVIRCENGFAIGPGNLIVGLPIPETDPEALYRAGIEAAGREDWRIAIAYFTAAHQRAHLVPRYLYNLGLAHARAGNAIPAIAWLSAYLIAEPETPRRAAVWQQIEALERGEEARIDRLWDRLSATIAAYHPPAHASGTHARWRFYDLATVAAAKAGDVRRAEALMREAVAAARGAALADLLVPNATELWHRVAAGAVEDGDLAQAEEAVARLGGRPIEDAGRLESLRRGESAVALNLSRLSPAFLGGASRCVESCPELAALRAGNGEEASRIADRTTRSSDLNALVMGRAAMGWADGALGAYELLRIMPITRLDIGANVAEILLLRGAMFVSEMPAALAATSRVSTPDARDAPRLSDYAAKTRALFTAEHGAHMQAAFRATSNMDRQLPGMAERSDAIIRSAEDADDDAALEALRAHALRQAARPDFLDRHDETASPRSSWLQARFDGPALLAEFHFNRGRFERAVRVAQRTDSIRLLRFYDYALERRAGRPRADGEPDWAALRAQALAAAGGGRGFGDGHRLRIEEAAIAALSLPGAAYDLPAWLDQVGRLPEPNQQILALRESAQSLHRALRRIRVAYRNSGGAWGR